MKKKGSIQDVALTMVVIFTMVVVIITVKYSYGTFVDKATNITSFNSSQAAVDVLDSTNELTNRYDTMIFTLLISFVLAIIVTGYLVPAEPIFAFLYFIVLVILVAVSAILSFVYEKIANKAIFADTISSLPIIDNIMTHFPVYMTVIGFIGMMVMYAKPQQQQ